MSPSATEPSFIIIGAGIFGAGTAYHLAKAIPSAAITLIDRSSFPCPLASSHDYNRVVRADYGDKFYMSLALKSQHEWRTNPFYKQFFHESGMVNIEGTGLGHRIVQNFKDLGVESKAEVIRQKNFIISSYPAKPASPDHYIAAGGSFYTWKFLPIIGEYVADLLRGILEPELVKRWGWDRSQEGGAQKMLKPKRDLSYLFDETEEEKEVVISVMQVLGL
ncbi:MAG: hypothetical protein Q9214_007265, partial [Letrouitia sp. 1 TL-2023]